MVERKSDPADRRAVALSLSRAGRALVPKLAREADRNDETFFASLSARNRTVFLTTIQNLLTQNQDDTRSPIEWTASSLTP